jgi:CDP-glucose 4,6-dehydratase
LWLTQWGARVTGVSLGVPTEPSHFQAAGLRSLLEDHQLDIRDGPALKALVQETQPDFVFHLAAQPIVRRSYSDPVRTWQTNTLGTINVLEALRELKKPCVAVFITSDKCYDNVEWVWGYRETDRLGGADPYSASKAGAELAIRSYVQSYFPNDGPVRIGVGRAGNVIGGGDWAENRIVPDCVAGLA